MKARLVPAPCFDNASPEKSFFFDDLVCFISPCLGVFVFTSKAENIGSMQFVETKEMRSRSPREVKFVRYISGWKILENRLNDELFMCLVVFQHDLHGQYLTQGKE